MPSKDKNIILPVGSLEWCVNQWIVAGPSRYILSVFQGGYSSKVVLTALIRFWKNTQLTDLFQILKQPLHSF